MWVVEGEGVGGGGKGKGEGALRGEGGPRGVGVHKGLLRCEGKAHGADAIYLEGPSGGGPPEEGKGISSPLRVLLPSLLLLLLLEPPKRGAPGPPLPRGPPHTSLASCSHLCPPQQQQVRTFSSGLRPPPISISVNYVSYLPAASKSTAVPRSLRHPTAPCSTLPRPPASCRVCISPSG